MPTFVHHAYYRRFYNVLECPRHAIQHVVCHLSSAKESGMAYHEMHRGIFSLTVVHGTEATAAAALVLELQQAAVCYEVSYTCTIESTKASTS